MYEVSLTQLVCVEYDPFHNRTNPFNALFIPSRSVIAGIDATHVCKSGEDFLYMRLEAVSWP